MIEVGIIISCLSLGVWIGLSIRDSFNDKLRKSHEKQIELLKRMVELHKREHKN